MKCTSSTTVQLQKTRKDPIYSVTVPHSFHHLDTSPQETSSYLLCPAKTQQLYHIWPCQLVVHSSPEPLDFIIDYILF